MAHLKLITPDDIIQTAVQMIEDNQDRELSLRGIAATLGVKAPSLYRYFSNKESLERAVAERILQTMFAKMRKTKTQGTAEAQFTTVVDSYLSFARKHFPLYSFVMDRVPFMQGSAIAKDVWNLLLEAASGISEQPDDTAAAVAVWSLLHGYVTLEHLGAFGASGPKNGLELGMTAFLGHLRRTAASAQSNGKVLKH